MFMLCSSSCWIFQSEFLGSKGVLHCDKKRQEGSPDPRFRRISGEICRKYSQQEELARET
jgi:hypothetical protein